MGAEVTAISEKVSPRPSMANLTEAKQITHLAQNVPNIPNLQEYPCFPLHYLAICGEK